MLSPLTATAWSTADEYTPFYFMGNQTMLDQLYAMVDEHNLEITFEQYDTGRICYPSYYTHHEPMIWETCYDSIIVGLVTLSHTPVPVPAALWLFGSGLGLMGILRRKTKS